MSAQDLITAAQSDELLREIQQQARDESRALLEAAEREARSLVSQAFASARMRTHEAIGEMRREGTRRLARARAQVETESRRRAQRAAAEAVRRAWPLLVEALVELWREPDSRRAWIEAAIREARTRMPPGDWIVEHPAVWASDEERHVSGILGRAAGSVAFQANRDIAAGIRIRTQHATLDATVQGLLADRHLIEAQLLAEIVPAGGDDGATAESVEQ